MTEELAVACGAALGAPARYLLDRTIGTPWGVLVVNLLGCAAAGLVVGAGVARLESFVLVGFLGSFTTASTVAWDVLTQPSGRRRLVLLALHVVPGLALAAAGVAVGRAW